MTFEPRSDFYLCGFFDKELKFYFINILSPNYYHVTIS
jgi:hypothetical protein